MNRRPQKLLGTIFSSIFMLTAITFGLQTGFETQNLAFGSEHSSFIGQTTAVSGTAYLPLFFNNHGSSTPPAGLISSNLFSIPNDQILSCEHAYTTRLTTNNFARGIHPQNMHFSSCNTETDTPTLYTSLTLAQTDPDNASNYFNNQSGMIVQSILNTTTNQLDTIGNRHFPECKEMVGIDTSNSCGVVAALCRTNSGRTDFDKDVVATHPNPNNWLQDEGKDEMWLYEWTNGDIQSEPAKYIVHKGIGSWEYGLYSLVYGENDNTYGVALKSTRGGHEADSFSVVDRDTYSLDTKRGWDWSCGSGHTIHNRPGYNPFTQEYGMLCGTDWNNLDAGRYGSISFTTETEENQNFLLLQQYRLRQKGGPGAVHPLADGGWLGIIVGADGDLSYEKDSSGNDVTPSDPVTQIGLVRFDQDGDLVGEVKWVVSTAPNYTSYPQLVPLENGNYLLGYGKMPATSDANPFQAGLHWQLIFPEEYWVQEIDVNGEAVSHAWRLDDVAWGELDELVSLGNNKVGWATYNMDRLTGTPDDGRWTQPLCNASELQMNVYTSPNP
ncbi:MAG: hypothetical protein AB8G95_21850 [Anaerolineae bacterium]